MGGFQVLNGQFGVVLEGFQALVRKEFLDVVKVGTAPDQLGGAAPPKGMRGHRDVQAGGGRLSLEDPTERVVGHALAVLLQEDGGLLLQKWRRAPISLPHSHLIHSTPYFESLRLCIRVFIVVIRSLSTPDLSKVKSSTCSITDPFISNPFSPTVTFRLLGSRK